MIATFIQASDKSPLVKNLITGESYPHITDLISFEHQIPDISFLEQAIRMHADKGHAMATGRFDKQLQNESRAGRTVREPAEYLILDIDADLPYTQSEIVTAICGQPTQYIFQHSASAQSQDSVRGHYWIRLSKPTPAETIKKWLKTINFDLYRDHLKLSNSKQALKWPVDIVVNDPGRIIFIAPPVCRNDPIKQRIYSNLEGQETFTLPDEIEEVDIQSEVNRLRNGEKLPEKVKPENNIIDASPDEIKITGIKEKKNFVYLNINGGDSWAYYFLTDNPDIVDNFKDEPRFRLKDIDPELHAKYAAQRPIDPANLQLVNGQLVQQTPAVFREFKSDTYWQIMYNPTNNEVLRMAPTSSKDRAIDFLVSNGGAKIKHVNDGTVIYDPQNPTKWDPVEKCLNIFESTPLMDIQKTQDVCPQLIHKVIKHICVDKECYDHFMNWLAYIYQKRDKTGTAWLFHGTTGTGKGTLYHDILKPIFGQNASTCLSENLNDMFNSAIQNTMVMFVDEFDITDLNSGGKAFNKIKNYITEKEITIRRMRTEQMQSRNLCNYIFSSNARVPIKVDESERRLNIPPRQNNKLEDLAEWRDDIVHELDAFCAFLRGYKVNEAKARTPIMNAARAEMIRNSRTSHDEFFIAIKTGDIDFFTDFVDDPNGDPILKTQYESIVRLWRTEMITGPVKICREDLLTCYRYIIEPTKVVTQNKFTAICRNNTVEFKPRRSNSDKRRYEFEVDFAENRYEAAENNVIYLKK